MRWLQGNWLQGNWLLLYISPTYRRSTLGACSSTGMIALGLGRCQFLALSMSLCSTHYCFHMVHLAGHLLQRSRYRKLAKSNGTRCDYLQSLDSEHLVD